MLLSCAAKALLKPFWKKFLSVWEISLFNFEEMPPNALLILGFGPLVFLFSMLSVYEFIS